MTRSGSIVLGCAAALWAASTDAASAPVPKEGNTPYTRWAVTADPATNEFHDPVAVKGLVVVGTDRGELRAFRAADGAPAWSYPHGTRIFYPATGDGERFYFTAKGKLTAVAADGGKKVWSFDLHEHEGPALALPDKGLVVTADASGTLFALDAKTGAKRWAADFAADAPPDPPGFSGDSARFPNTKARPTALATDGETVFVSVFDQCRVVAVTAATGKRAWALQTKGWVYGAATATATHVFVGSQDKRFYCADKKTGEVWAFETKGRIESGGAADDKSVYFGSCDGSFYAVTQADGKERWRFDTDRHTNGKTSAIYSTPVLRQGVAYFAAGEGQFYAVATDTGAARARLRPQEQSEMYCSPATDGRSFFVTTRPSARGDAPAGASALVAIALK